MAVNIAAAASLTNGLDDVIAEFKKDMQYQDTVFTVIYGSSGALARQIIGTSGYTPIYPDVFISASEGAMDVVNNAGKLANNTRFDWVGNSLVIVRNNISGQPYPVINNFGDVAQSTANMATTHIWLPNPYDPDFVPAGIYAETTFKQYTPDAKHWDYVFAKATSDETVAQDVQYTLNGVLSDGSPAIGVVYNSDAKGADLTPIVTAPTSINLTIIYPAAQVTQSLQDTGTIGAFLEFLNTDSTREILTDSTKGYGFRLL
ncbi:MAG: molybdate ABC transporter substrate-binding protein [Synergistaceae bacterium]|nr:molybdate ABC transporter substrate-binding protein [Synergistaceae bacterium]